MTTPLVSPPYGQDTAATTRVFFGQISSGAQLVGEAMFRRFITETGTLEYDQDYGFNVAGALLSAGPNPSIASLMALRSRMTREALKDERVDDVVVTITQNANGATLSLDIEIDVTLDTGDTFTLSLNVNDVTTTLLGIE